MFHINSLQQSIETKLTIEKDVGNLEKERSDIDSICIQNNGREINNAMGTDSLISFEQVEMPAPIEIVRQPFSSTCTCWSTGFDTCNVTSSSRGRMCTRHFVVGWFCSPRSFYAIAHCELLILVFGSFYMCLIFLSSFWNSWQIMKREPAVKIASHTCYVLNYIHMRYIIIVFLGWIFGKSRGHFIWMEV